jgi:hypothetical protein
MSGEKDVPEKIHAELGASVASRWMACPGSIRLSREVPVPASTSFAEEGTRAHALAELCLRRNVGPETYVGIELEGGVITDEMAEHVRVFYDYCNGLDDDSGHSWVERKFNLAPLNPPGPMFGTADFVAYDAVERTLHVVDLKYGQGVVVEAKGNKQLRYYALGAALSLDDPHYPIDKVVMTIVQPRALHTDGPIRSDEATHIELIEFAAELMDAARKTLEPDAPLVAGTHCRFCPASGVCPAQRDRALAVAQSEFDIVEAEFTPPAPETIPPEMFAEMLGKLHILEDWASAMRATALSRLERGEEVPGFKLVQKRATRQWTDPEDVANYLLGDGYDGDEIYKPRDLKSVAQIEKLVGKKAFAASPLAGAVVKVSSGVNIAPATDPRPAVNILTVGEEFGLLLPAPEE